MSFSARGQWHVHQAQFKEGCLILAGLASLVGKAFVVGATAPSVAAAARADPERFVLAERGGTLGVEELMEKVEDFVGSFILG